MKDDERRGAGGEEGEVSDDGLDVDSVEVVPVERRDTPRGMIPGLVAEVLDGPPGSQTFEVHDVGLESFFLLGARSEPGQSLRIRLSLDDEAHECSAECVRCEEGARAGVVLRLLPDQPEARAFFEAILQPSNIPPGCH